MVITVLNLNPKNRHFGRQLTSSKFTSNYSKFFICHTIATSVLKLVNDVFTNLKLTSQNRKKKQNKKPLKYI